MNVSGMQALRMFARGAYNNLRNKPFSVSFEITHYCTANCWHCNWGGPYKEEKRLDPDDYARICRDLNPVVINISGGEPLARKDVVEVAGAMSHPSGLPYIALVTNAAALSVDKYEALREAGVHQFSVSLDFPDERHSEFRRIPGLFEKMDERIPAITARGNGDLSLNVCITAWNYRDVPDMVRLAQRWNTSINFSVYTPLRVDDHSGMPPAEEMEQVRAVFQKVLDMKREGYPVYSSDRVMWNYFQFLYDRRFPGCQAGRRFLVVNPDGMLTPCAMVWAKYPTQQEMLEQFTAHNTCEQCFISTRSSTEKKLSDFVADNWDTVRETVMRRWTARPAPSSN